MEHLRHTDTQGQKLKPVPDKSEGGSAYPGEFCGGDISYLGKKINLLVEIIEQDEDVTKMIHSIIDAQTKKVLKTIDWSPYSEITRKELELYIELGCPNRIGFCPLNGEDLQKIKDFKEKTAKIKKELQEEKGIEV
jgi:hypothetical protein